MFDPWALAESLGYPAAALGVLLESAGIPFPGETALVAVAALAGAREHLDIRLVILAGCLGTVAGADLGYLAGYWGGRPLVERFGHLFRVNPGHISRAEMFFARHGDKAVLASRFVVGVRTWGMVLAGMSRMPFWRFQVFSALGGVAWAVAFGLLGYVLGNNLPLLDRVVRGIGYGGLLLVLTVALIALLVRRRAART